MLPIGSVLRKVCPDPVQLRTSNWASERQLLSSSLLPCQRTLSTVVMTPLIGGLLPSQDL